MLAWREVRIFARHQRRARIRTGRTGSGLKPILAGSELDRTEKFCCFDVIILITSSMLVVMWFCRLVR